MEQCAGGVAQAAGVLLRMVSRRAVTRCGGRLRGQICPGGEYGGDQPQHSKSDRVLVGSLYLMMCLMKVMVIGQQGRSFHCLETSFIAARTERPYLLRRGNGSIVVL